VFERLTPMLRLQLKCLDIATRCSCAVFENGVRTMSSEQERALNIVVRAFEHEVDDLGHRARRIEPTITDSRGSVRDAYPPVSLVITLCRLHIQVFYFFQNHPSPNDRCFSRFLSTACAVIDEVVALTPREACYPALPCFITTGVLLSSACLLRLLKTSLIRDLDEERARSYFFQSITLMKRLSIDTDDSAGMCAALMNQLWNSAKVFRKPDGTEHPALRIRGRLVTSPLLDAVWWWRQEFDPQHKLGLPRGDARGM
jgi:hypothetical protein